jgi:hypothetical protein
MRDKRRQAIRAQWRMDGEEIPFLLEVFDGCARTAERSMPPSPAAVVGRSSPGMDWPGSFSKVSTFLHALEFQQPFRSPLVLTSIASVSAQLLPAFLNQDGGVEKNRYHFFGFPESFRSFRRASPSNMQCLASVLYRTVS